MARKIRTDIAKEFRNSIRNPRLRRYCMGSRFRGNVIELTLEKDTPRDILNEIPRTYQDSTGVYQVNIKIR